MEYESVEREINNFLRNASKEFEFYYEIINIRHFMRKVFTKDENVWSAFSDGEKADQHKFKSPKKRIQWMAGRYAGKMAFVKMAAVNDTGSDFKKIDLKQIRILNGLNSAPYIEGYPGLNISISHSYPYCVAVVSQRRIGVDIENTISEIKSLLGFYYTENEIKELNKLYYPGNDDKACEVNCLATLYWTRKEAVSKLYRLGMNMDFHEIDTVYNIIKINNIEKVRTVSIQNRYCSLSLAFVES
ncbi:phosphopantetheinyl transferase [Ruminiclostridium sufflavum DSM 19573]|uniref:Phosphopantetheinyl transferase n=1 Tax=Ruminiclostridium sufflavum DSM 19573 TaxID=1121337 RepID=A0A318XIV7_9FIRM|nr:4'-phosphopantetheinyl transferase superfamily protein [Ruminiclostridium sufflavum]PYG85773.1 phosphopantetheinyl transferase [Ruminiclostridium sufflavum DSM 19573]